MESPPPKRNFGHDGEDGISALPDHLLLDILERLDLREAVRAGAVSTRWRHLPRHLSRVHLDAGHFRGATSLQVMDAFTGAAQALLARVPPAEGVCESGALKVLVLGFYMSSPHRSSIGRLVEDIIWIQPEPPKQLIAIFRNLTSVRLFHIFSECDLSWTLFILEAAPALHDMALSRHSCIKTPEYSAEKTNVVWEPSKDLEHLNLKVLQIFGCEDEDKVTNYIRLVMERAVGLLIIQLYGENPCIFCDATNLERSKVEKASRRRIKQQLTHGSSSSVEIIVR